MFCVLGQTESSTDRTQDEREHEPIVVLLAGVALGSDSENLKHSVMAFIMSRVHWCHQSLRHVPPTTAVTTRLSPPPTHCLWLYWWNQQPWPRSHFPSHRFFLEGGVCSPHFFFPSISAAAQRRNEGVFIYKTVCLLSFLSFFLFFNLSFISYNTFPASFSSKPKFFRI